MSTIRTRPTGSMGLMNRILSRAASKNVCCVLWPNPKRW